MSAYLTKRWGEGISDPRMEDLEAALAELDVDDPEHPDCWLADEHDWTISAFGNGRVILENPETNEGPWHMRDVPRAQIIELWNLLQRGSIDDLKQQPWKSGYE